MAVLCTTKKGKKALQSDLALRSCFEPVLREGLMHALFFSVQWSYSQTTP